MKPLELTVYRTLEDFGVVFGYDTPEVHATSEADAMAAAKRFTDTELAAEVYFSIFHEAECEVRGLRLILRDPENPAIDHWAEHNHEFGRQADILRRFATTPHYDEVTA